MGPVPLSCPGCLPGPATAFWSQRRTAQASRSCWTSEATVSSAAASSEATVTSAPLPAPRVMIISAEPASTGSPPSRDRVTGTPALSTASAMTAAGRACSPIADPTMTVLVGMGGSPFCGGVRMSGGNEIGGRFRIGLGLGELLGGDDCDGADDGARRQGNEEPRQMPDGEEHEDAAVWRLEGHVERHDQRTGHRTTSHHRRNDAKRVGRGEWYCALRDERGTEKPCRAAVLALGFGEQARSHG